MNQIIFIFPAVDEFYEEDFIVSAANLKAYNMVANYTQWPEKRLIISGEEGSGKSHLCRIFALRSNALILPLDFEINFLPIQNLIFENIEQFEDETKLFHLINFAKNNDLYLLLTTADKNHEFKLSDLASRLNSTSKANIKSPDEILFRAILYKNFHSRQITLDPEIIDYITIRLHRSFKAIKEFVQKVDSYSLTTQRRITIPLIKKVLNTYE